MRSNGSGTAEVEFVTVHGKRRAFVKTGSGPALLLLHGLACDRTTWDRVVPLLAKKYTVIAPDLLGHGLSDKPRADYTLGGYANGMRDLLTVLGIDKVTRGRPQLRRRRRDAVRVPVPGAHAAGDAGVVRGPRSGGHPAHQAGPGTRVGGGHARADPARHPAPRRRRRSAPWRRTASARCASSPATSTRQPRSSSRGRTGVPGSRSATWSGRSSTGAARSSPCPIAPT